MANDFNETIQMLLNYPIISRLRRNHGLEHATLHVLSQRYPGVSLAGHSDLSGFWIIGDIATDDLRSAMNEALRRLQTGDRLLAIHPNCGTNLVVAGFLSAVAGLLGMVGVGRRFRDKLERLPLAVSLATLALFFARPLGLMLQAHITTSGEPQDLYVAEVHPVQRGWMRTHRIITRG